MQPRRRPRLLLDENIPYSLKRMLAARGYQVEHMADIAPGASDHEVLELARSRNAVIVTLDKDFGRLVLIEEPDPPPVIVLRLRPKPPPQWLPELLEAVETALAGLEQAGALLAVVTAKGVRLRGQRHAEPGAGQEPRRGPG